MSVKDIELIRYSPSLKKDWDDFVEDSKNGTFLFKRDYLEYHSDRFPDYSFLVYRKGKLYCLFPATRKESVAASHTGLTYGGLVMSKKTTAQGILDVFDVLITALRIDGVKELIYKPVPYIYSLLPSQEDLYALFRHEALLSVRNISSTIDQKFRLNFIKDRRAAVRKAENNGVTVRETSDLESFYKILSENLREKYDAAPIHSLDELERLQNMFPGNIRLFGAYLREKLLGGVLCYISHCVVHAQYISANHEGKETGAIDLIIHYLLNEEFSHFRYFDLGTSNENGGKYLNETLIYQKEGFGGRAVCYDTYLLRL